MPAWAALVPWVSTPAAPGAAKTRRFLVQWRGLAMRSSSDHRTEDSARATDGSGCASGWVVGARTMGWRANGPRGTGCHPLGARPDATTRPRRIAVRGRRLALRKGEVPALGAR